MPMQRQGVSNISVKQMNLDSVYWFIYAHRQVSAKDIVQGLNLSLPTVTQNLRQLTALGLIASGGMMESTGGRKARSYALNGQRHLTLGLDITKGRVALALIDLSGSILGHGRRALAYRNHQDYYQAVGQLALDFLSDMGKDPRDLLGAGLSLPAIVSGDGSQAAYAYPLEQTQPIPRDAFQAHLPFPCTLLNDANAGGYAECWAMDPARTRQDRSLAYLSVSDTVGGSIMVGGKMYLGMEQHSAEFGHMTLVPGGETCYCGQAGCANAYINTRRLAEFTGGDLDAFFQRLAEGDAALARIWAQYLEHLALTIANIRSTLDCEVIIGGYLGRYIGPYMAQLRQRVARRNIFEGSGDYLLAGTQVCECAAVGAALTHQYAGVKRLLREGMGD